MRNLKFWIAAALILASGCANAFEQVEIPSGDVKLRGVLYRPRFRPSWRCIPATVWATAKRRSTIVTGNGANT